VQIIQTTSGWLLTSARRHPLANYVFGLSESQLLLWRFTAVYGRGPSYCSCAAGSFAAPSASWTTSTYPVTNRPEVSK